MEERILTKKNLPQYKTRALSIARLKIHYFYDDVRPDPFGMLRTICNVRTAIDHKKYLKKIRLRNSGIYKDIPPDVCKICSYIMKKDYPTFKGLNHGMEVFT